ncbi:hypothetical protein PsorP6_009558 [Peronosclerospora sorghi]|uniref:Uncharacterized protein n=1 Tax=Peronosclerospora sorghi TaxID=230839 RepID=A0ACC0W0F0_9STRA|nr:hypothetical protein PsorP6_009558 [Peronosclerospora sorghi]
MLVIGCADAIDNCDSNVLVKAYEGLNVNQDLVSCMTKNNFSAALDGSVDLTTTSATTIPDQVKAICASDSCKIILSALVVSANFNITNCIVGNNIELMAQISSLHATCTTSSAGPSPTNASTAAAQAPTGISAGPDQSPSASTEESKADAKESIAPVEAPAAAVIGTAPIEAPAAAVIGTAPVEAPAAAVIGTASIEPPSAGTAATAPAVTHPAPAVTQSAPAVTQSAPAVTQSAPAVNQSAPACTY